MSDENVGAAAAGAEKDIYTDFDAFLKRAIHEYYKTSGKKHKGNFIALLIASGEGPSLALDSIKSGSGTKKLALGAAGLLALRVGLRYALSGPLGIILAGATAASLVAYFVRNRRRDRQPDRSQPAARRRSAPAARAVPVRPARRPGQRGAAQPDARRADEAISRRPRRLMRASAGAAGESSGS